MAFFQLPFLWFILLSLCSCYCLRPLTVLSIIISPFLTQSPFSLLCSLILRLHVSVFSHLHGKQKLVCPFSSVYNINWWLHNGCLFLDMWTKFITQLEKLLLDILKFSFHSSSTVTPVLKLSNQSEVLPGLTQNFPHFLLFLKFHLIWGPLKPISSHSSLFSSIIHPNVMD